MFRQRLFEELTLIFSMTPVEWSGYVESNAESIYIEYQPITVNVFSEKSVRFSGVIDLSIMMTRADQGVGFLSTKFNEHDVGDEKQILKALDNEETIMWRGADTLWASKRFSFTIEMEHNTTIETIKGVECE